jgi:hypothetical protein
VNLCILVLLGANVIPDTSSIVSFHLRRPSIAIHIACPNVP